MKDIIKIHTDPGDLILDPFMGSGTTGVACLECNRFFMGVELSNDYFNLSNSRLKEL